MGIIISSFIGCGKKYLTNVYGNKVNVYDAEQNIDFDINNEESLETYFNTVMDNVDKYDIVFIGSNEKIRNKFNENNVDYDIFYPSSERRGEFIENQVRLRTNPKIIRELDKDFDKLVQNIDDDDSPNCYKHKLSNQGEFIGNTPIIMQYIDSLKETNNKANTQSNDAS